MGKYRVERATVVHHWCALLAHSMREITEKKKIKLDDSNPDIDSPGWSELPKEFVQLVARSLTLRNRVMTLDAELYGESTRSDVNSNRGNPVGQQIDLLSTALGAIKR